jgi:hypothetical protein
MSNETKNETKKVKSTTLIGERGTLRLSTKLRKDGTFLTFALVVGPKDKDGKRERLKGATQEHSDIASATHAIVLMTKNATAGGWAAKVSKNVMKNDAFTINSIPSAKITKK